MACAVIGGFGAASRHARRCPHAGLGAHSRMPTGAPWALHLPRNSRWCSTRLESDAPEWAARLDSEEAAALIRRMLTERRDGQVIFRTAMNNMTSDQRRQIGLAWAFGELPKEFSKSDENRDGVLSAEEFIKWGQEMSTEGAKQAEDRGDAPPATSWQLRRLYFRQIAPFFGFGFIDNSLMILSGEALDLYLGVAFGISTMAAAALGNAFSNAIGMGSHGLIEKAASSLGIPDPNLSMEQLGQPRCQLWKTLGGITGIVSGCIMGMCPLLFMPTKGKHDDHETH